MKNTLLQTNRSSKPLLSPNFYPAVKILNLLIFSIFFSVGLTAQTIYSGNGKTGFGDVIGNSTLQISDDGTDLSFFLTKGPGHFNDIVVIYINAPNRTQLNSVSSESQTVSVLPEKLNSYIFKSNRSDINFPTGFNANFEIILAPIVDFGGIWDLDRQDHNFISSVNLNPLTNNSPAYSFSIPWTKIGLTGIATDDFNFVVTYVSLNGFRSNEAIGASDATDENPGDSNLTFSESLEYKSAIALPVELTSFTAKNLDGKVNLNWETKSETNNYGWEIQVMADRKPESGIWKKVGFAAGKGTTTEKQNYSFSSPIAHNAVQLQFRLKQIDLDGKVSFSAILAVDVTPAKFSVLGNYPNPFNPSTQLVFDLPADGLVSLQVFNVIGQDVFENSYQLSAGKNSIPFLSGKLSNGMYHYKISFNNQTITKSMILMK